jgi:gamma-glutamyl hercynylcysteine S-oxide synthase
VDLKALVAAHLERARARTNALLAPFDDADLRRQVSPLMSPLVWDLAHIGHYEELWLQRTLAGSEPTDVRFDDLYDAFAHPRRERAGLSILEPDAARRYVADVRARTLGVLDRVELDDGNPLLDRAFVYGMVIQHEHMHCETMLATIQLMGVPFDVRFGPTHPTTPAVRGGVSPEWTEIPGGTFVMGTDDEPWAFDNERPAHEVEVPPFRLGTRLVTNADYRSFIAGGGYDDPRHWTEIGWKWRQEASLEHPQGWRREGDDSWSRVRFGQRADLEPDEPVQHVCWYEADAYARWAGARLPTEAEWELAASWGPDARKRRYPWGDEDPAPGVANLGQSRLGPTASSPTGASAWGCLQMTSDLWEWTASDFEGYPGFRAFPYREYSEVFFGDEYKVLRGGSWAVPPVACRNTFRNWDYPIRRQIFCGFRLAHDA